jgi:hypothetical protein
VAVQNKQDFSSKLLFEAGTREKELKRERKVGLPEINYIDLDTEEERDKEMITVLLKKYYKALRHIFLKFANTGMLLLFFKYELKQILIYYNNKYK